MPGQNIYRSSDASAPVLTGSVGDLINLLNKCLVTGYGSKAAAGWTKPYDDAGTPLQRAVFRMGGGNQFYLDVDDRGASSVLTTGQAAREAAVRGYEAMTGIGVGTNPFPTTAQIAANTANWRKSTSADAVARSWLMAADDRTLILIVSDGDSANNKVYYFGDFYATKVGDAYRTCITTRTGGGTSQNGAFGANPSGIDALAGSQGFYIARTQAGSGTAVVGNYAHPDGTNLAALAATGDGYIYISRWLLGEPSANTFLRGYLRGVYSILTTGGVNDGDTFSGAVDLTGRTFLVVKNYGNQSGTALAIETSTWDVSS